MDVVAQGAQLGMNELRQFLQDPEAYSTIWQHRVDVLTRYARTVAERLGEAALLYEKMQSDTDLTHEFRMLKRKGRKIFRLIGQNLVLVDKLRSAADPEREESILAEVSDCRNDGVTVFNFHNVGDRARFPILASFLAEVKILVEKMESKCKDIQDLVEILLQEASGACTRGNTRARNLWWLKTAAVAGAATVVGIATGPIGWLLGGAVGAVGAGAVGGGAAGVVVAGTYDEKSREGIERLAKLFDDLHTTALRLDNAASNTSDVPEHIRGELDASFIRTGDDPPPDLQRLPVSLRKLFHFLQSLNVEREKENLMKIKPLLEVD